MEIGVYFEKELKLKVRNREVIDTSLFGRARTVFDLKI